MARKVPFQLYLTQEQYEHLKVLTVYTRIPISELIRGAVDDMLLKSDSIEHMEVHVEEQSNENLE
jgi:hypothetical protein